MQKAINNTEADALADSDDVLLAFSEARDATPNDKTLLRLWTARYPELADDLVAVDYARFAAGLTLTDALEDGPPDAEVAALGREVLAARRAAALPKPPLTSLVADAAARGLDAGQLAQALRLDRLLLGRLEQRVLEAATLPVTLVQQIAQLLERSSDEVAAYLRGGPRLAAHAHFHSRRAPKLSSQAQQVSFAEALERGQGMSAEDKEYWQTQVDAGVLGVKTRE